MPEANARPDGGLGTKIHLAADRRCRPVSRILSPCRAGQRAPIAPGPAIARPLKSGAAAKSASVTRTGASWRLCRAAPSIGAERPPLLNARARCSGDTLPSPFRMRSCSARRQVVRDQVRAEPLQVRRIGGEPLGNLLQPDREPVLRGRLALAPLPVLIPDRPPAAPHLARRVHRDPALQLDDF